MSKIELSNYRNYEKVKLDLSNGFNIIIGDNGMGKTNLLDSIHYLCIGKSYFSSGDRYVIKSGTDFIRTVGYFNTSNGLRKAVAKVVPGQKKVIEIDERKVDRLSDYVGNFPCMIIAPADIDLLVEGSEDRRNLMNKTIVQYDKEYAEAISKYMRLLKQRNALLKSELEGGVLDFMVLKSIDLQLEVPSQLITAKRDEFIRKLIPIFSEIYQTLSGHSETCHIEYSSTLLTQPIKDILEECIAHDRRVGRTTKGIHKDDLLFFINGEKLKPYASQGQLKSFVIALKIAEYVLLKEAKNITPILILDDIFDKLDMHRIRRMIALLVDLEIGQVFVSDTHPTRILTMVKELNVDYSTFEIVDGQIASII